MKRKGKTLTCLLAALSGTALADGSPPMPTLDFSPKTTCMAEAREWQGFDRPRQRTCLGLDLGFPLSRKVSARVGSGVQLTGLGIRYRFDEFWFTEARLDRRQDSFSLIFVWRL
jgi:hypothetical protein